MGIEITKDEKLSGKDMQYPLVLNASIKQSGETTLDFVYRLKVEGNASLKKVTGEVKSSGGSSSSVSDDDDWADLSLAAEGESIGAVVNFLKKQFPGAKIEGAITGNDWYLRNAESRIYNI